MTVPIEFVATGRPSSVNATTEKKRNWKRRVNRVARIELARQFGTSSPAYSSDVTVKVFYFPTNRQYVDVDNGLKHTIDAISPPILQNDKTVQRLVVERFLPVPGSSLVAPISYAATLVNAFNLANGLSRPGRAVHATAVKVESYVANGGSLW